MSEPNNKSGIETRHLQNTASANYLRAQPDNLPPDESLPWVLELRVVGTAEIIYTRLSDTMLIGRKDPARQSQPEIDLTPHHAHQHGVSRRHAQLQMRDGRITIRDLASTNGTQLNGFDLLPQTEYRLRHGDELALGQFRLQIFFSVVPARADALAGEPARPPASQIPVLGKGQRVLVIADDPDVGAVFRASLARAGFAVTVVRTPAVAMEEVSERLPDAIVVDLPPPDVLALDFVRYVRKSVTRRVPVLVVSGATAGFHMSRALEAGADQFLGKPLSIEDLVSAVGKAVIQPAS